MIIAKQSRLTLLICLLSLTCFIGCQGSERKSQGNGAGARKTTGGQPSVKHWRTLLELSGTGAKSSSVFTLAGGSARLSYVVGPPSQKMEELQSADFSIFHVFLFEEGMSDIGNSVLSVGGFEDGDTWIHQSPGRYYLKVIAGNCDWTLVMNEESL